MVVVATDEELRMAKERFPDEEIIKTGVGGVNVYKTLRNFPEDTEVLNFGHVGSNNLAVGTEVEIGECKLYHPNVEYTEETFNLGGNIPCYTSNDFVLKTDIQEPVVFDMELAYICAMFKNVRSIKIVSDNLSLKEYETNVEELK